MSTLQGDFFNGLLGQRNWPAEEGKSAAKKYRYEIEERPHGVRLCAMMLPGTSLNLGASLGYNRQLDEQERGGKELSNFAAYR